ncbi:hypothetical protein BGZ82_008797 [Podila clonocystis]|nr:hypothetical protein BGZ82_008797 [Podila clonocystis]
MCMTRAAWEERTYIKTIGNCTLMCDRIIHMDGAETLSAEEEAEAWGLFREALDQLKKVLYIHALRNIHPIHVDTEAGKLVLFSFEDAYWDEYAAAHEGELEQIENLEVIKEAAAAAFAAAYPDKKKATESDDATEEE